MKHPFQNWVVLFRWCIGTGRHLVHTGVDLDAFQYTVVELTKIFCECWYPQGVCFALLVLLLNGPSPDGCVGECLP